MVSYTVHRILTRNSRQLLLVQGRNDSQGIELCIYNEHTGSTELRLCSPTLEEFERAIQILKSD